MIGLWLLSILYLILGIANIVRGVLALAVADVLLSDTLSVPLPVLGVIYLVFGVGFLSSLVVYARDSEGSPRGRWLVLGIALGYQVVMWMIHIVWNRALFAQRLWVRDLALTVAFLALVVASTDLVKRARQRERV